MKKIQYLAFLILCIVSEMSFSEPTKIDYFKTGSGLSIFLYSQYIYKNKNDKFQYYRQENINSFDQGVDALKIYLRILEELKKIRK